MAASAALSHQQDTYDSPTGVFFPFFLFLALNVASFMLTMPSQPHDAMRSGMKKTNKQNKQIGDSYLQEEVTETNKALKKKEPQRNFRQQAETTTKPRKGR